MELCTENRMFTHEAEYGLQLDSYGVDVWFFFDFSCETPSRSDWGVNFIKDDDLPLTMLFV